MTDLTDAEIEERGWPFEEALETVLHCAGTFEERLIPEDAEAIEEAIRHRISRLLTALEEARAERDRLRAGLAAFRAAMVHAPVMLEAEDWERWYQRVMTTMDCTAHMVTAEDHERADEFLPEVWRK